MVSFPVLAVVVNFPDPGLEAAIRDAIGKSTGDIHDTDLVGLTSLNASERNIASLEGIQRCVDLTELYLWDNRIIDISPLSDLTNLRGLYLYINGIVDISSLSGLTNLTGLGLTWNQIVDISALSGLINLTRLYLDNNQISDIAPLVDNAGIDSGDIVDLRENQLFLQSGSPDMLDIEALQSQEVDIEFDPQNPIVVNFPDPGLEAVIRDAIGRPMGDIHDINLTELIRLDAEDWGITSLEGIQYCVNFTWVDLRDNEIADISALESLINLTSLDLSNNEIVDINTLSNLTNLIELSLYNNPIVDISPLSGLTNLTKLGLGRNQIIDIQALACLSNLTELNLDKNEIVDISVLAGLIHLKELNLSDNQISDILPLVSNAGIDSGDIVNLRENQLVLQSGSPDMLDIETLQGRGVYVDFDPQN